jgi:hypothetical protein
MWMKLRGLTAKYLNSEKETKKKNEKWDLGLK